METRIIKFISALRSMGVPVSLAESADAFRAVDSLGIHDRENFRLSLRATLIKDQHHLESFDKLFPLFFDSSGHPPMTDISQDLAPDEASQVASSLQQLNQYLQDLLQRLLEGDPLAQEELQQFSQMVGLQHADNLRYQPWMQRRMEQALRFPEIRAAIDQLIETLSEFGFEPQRKQQLKDLMQENLQSWQDQIKQHVGSQIAQNLDAAAKDTDVHQLLNKNFNTLSEHEMQTLRNEVRRLSTMLRSRVALRQKRAKNGVLDPKSTIRANLKHGGVPFDIKYRNRHLKPKLVILCDISTSMRYCSELMLSLIFELKGLVSRTHAFAFIDHLEYITPDFAGKQANEAVSQVLQRMPPGYYSTDLGFSLQNFSKKFMEHIDSRTSLIMVGDARNNYNNPNLEVFRTLARRSHRTIWINPESRSQWGTGDSDMWEYAPYCHDILKAGTLKELTIAVDKFLG